LFLIFEYSAIFPQQPSLFLLPYAACAELRPNRLSSDFYIIYLLSSSEISTCWQYVKSARLRARLLIVSAFVRVVSEFAEGNHVTRYEPIRHASVATGRVRGWVERRRLRRRDRQRRGWPDRSWRRFASCGAAGSLR